MEINGSLKKYFQLFLEKRKEELEIENDDTQTQNPTENNDIEEHNNKSLFSDSFKEFKEYLVEEIGFDDSIYFKSFNQIMNLELDKEMLNALEEAEELNEFEYNKIKDKENWEEIVTEIEEKETEDNTNAEVIDDLINKIWDNETAIKFIDKNGDAELNEEEKTKFIESIKKYDENKEELSVKDIQLAFEDLSDQLLKKEQKKTLSESQTPEKTNTKELSHQQHTSNTPSISTGGSISGSPNSYYASKTSKANSAQQTIQTDSIPQLEAQKTELENNLNTKQEEYNKLASGNSEEVLLANKTVEETQLKYDEAVEKDTSISEELKTQREENLSAINETENNITSQKTTIATVESEIFNLESNINSIKSSLSALKSSLNSLTNQTTTSEEQQAKIDSNITSINSEIAQQEKELESQEANIEIKKKEKTAAEEILAEEQKKLDELNTTRAEIEAQISETCSPETKTALEAFQQAKINQEKKKTEAEKQTSTIKEEINNLQNQISEIDSKINKLKEKEIQDNYKVSQFDFDFELTMSSGQKASAKAFEENWNNNKERYEKIEQATGVPAELIASIHWRESSGNFNTYLHNGQKLGQVTTIVPKGIYFENWEDAAVDAINSHNPEIVDSNDIETWYEYAERYNGLGYRNKGKASPYVWAGTNNYTSGKYVSDGVYDSNHVDQQLGVALMLKLITS